MGEPRTMCMEMHFGAGRVSFRFPENLTEEDANDIEALLSLVMRGIRRRANKSTEDTTP